MRTLFLIALLASPGCIAGALAGPASDHHVQTMHIARACAAGTYGPCSKELQEDLAAMQEHACLIDAIASKQGAEVCEPAEAGE
jgi:hypothetical protein